MARAASAKWSHTKDMWPADTLASWRNAPLEAFTNLLAEQKILFERNFRSNSVRTYKAIFSWWCEKLGERLSSLLEASAQDAIDIFAQEELEPVSRRRYLQLLDRVYDYLLTIGWTGRNPMKVVLLQERELVLDFPPGLSNEALDLLIARLADIPGWKGARDRAAAALLIGAGLRANELIHLKMDELLPNYEIMVNPVGVHAEHKTVVLPGGPWRAWLDAWLPVMTDLGIPKHLVCPATRAGKGYSASGLFRRVSYWLEPLGELPQSGPNMLRNTFARKALTSGIYRVGDVQAFLGHAEDRATSRHVAAMGLRIGDDGWVL